MITLHIVFDTDSGEYTYEFSKTIAKITKIVVMKIILNG